MSVSPQKRQLNVAVLAYSSNQRERSVTVLKQLFAMKPATWNVRVYFVDDGSTDGTQEAVDSLGMNVKIVSGNGAWHWSRSMQEAQKSIDQPFDAILWVSNDVVVFQDAYTRIDEFRSQYPSSILVAQFCHPESGSFTYGGYQRVSNLGFRFEAVFADKLPLNVDTFSGKLIFLPKEAMEKVGSVHGKLPRNLADVEYGLRAASKKVRALALPGFYGTCTRKSPELHQDNEMDTDIFSPLRGSGFVSKIKFLRYLFG